MPNWFSICLFGAFLVVPIHCLSVQHLKLQGRYGKEQGTKIGSILGFVSGWGFFVFWIGIWVSPQQKFILPLFQNLTVLILNSGLSIPLLHLIISTPFLVLGIWLGIMGVRQITLKVAETHRTEKIVITGVYSIVRHPQYFGGLLAHMGISFLLSGWYSLLATPLIIVLVYLISKIEETELVREFGKEYKDYKKKVPMFIPRFCHL